jgi:drug/metabolite transporter (DMT)-like permease
MNWLVVTIIAYTLIAFGVILDKFLLSPEKISHPAIYTFYSGVLSLVAVFFFPFGFHGVTFSFGLLSIFAGIIYTAGILTLFFALAKNEASRVTVVVGAVSPIVSFFLALFLLDEGLGFSQILGIFILIVGGVLISLDFGAFKKIGEKKFFAGFSMSILSGLFLGAGFTLFKVQFEQDNFFNVYIWTRFGVLFGAALLFLHPKWRRAIFNSLKKFKSPAKDQRRTGLLFVLNKGLNGAGSILLNFAISLGSVTIVNALISIEYALVFIFGILFSIWMPKYFSEHKSPGVFLQKSVAIIIIAVGMYLIY